MDNTFKPKISAAGGKSPVLSKIELDFMKIIERKNLERVQKLKLTQGRNKYTGWALGFSAFSIYLYSMYAIKQETFLDDFNEPPKVLKE